MEGEVVIMNDIFQLENEGETADGRLRGRYRVSRARPGFFLRLAYYGLEKSWAAAMGDAERHDEEDAYPVHPCDPCPEHALVERARGQREQRRRKGAGDDEQS